MSCVGVGIIRTQTFGVCRFTNNTTPIIIDILADKSVRIGECGYIVIRIIIILINTAAVNLLYDPAFTVIGIGNVCLTVRVCDGK